MQTEVLYNVTQKNKRSGKNKKDYYGDSIVLEESSQAHNKHLKALQQY